MIASPCHALDPPPPLSAEQDSFAAQAAMYRVLVENAIDVIIRYDANRSRTYVSPSSSEIFGYTPAEMLGSLASMVIHPEDFVRVHPFFLSVGSAQPSLKLTFRAKRKDGIYIWIEGQYRYLAEDGGSIAVMRDITARKNAEIMLEEANAKLEAANHTLRNLAQQDGLTGLSNRRRFDELLGQEFRRAVRQGLPLALLLADVDFFKAYNDRYGHLGGDECLRQISRAIESVPQRPADQVARYGGEEFVVLLPAIDLAGAMLLAEQVRKAVSALAMEHLGSVHGIVTISIGASAMIPSGNNEPAHLIDAADRALYRAKAGGRNQICSNELLAAG